MKVDGRLTRTIWLAADGRSVEVIDQTRLPHAFTTLRLAFMEEAAHAIRSMQVRGAPLIGATAAYGVALAMAADPSDSALDRAVAVLGETRPTAVNLHWALAEMQAVLRNRPQAERADLAYAKAAAICDEDVVTNRAIGGHGLALFREAYEAKGGPKAQGRPLRVLTHCNAGWLACVDWGTALAPIYLAHDEGMPLEVWVDETRPRTQGALTAWELKSHGVPHKVIVDNAGGLLMRQGQVDLCIVGTDRVAANGDVANKIGTYLKALAARDNGLPFYVALPGPTIDWSLPSGDAIPIEERAEEEVTLVTGRTADGGLATVSPYPAGTRASNAGFDVTPARLVTALVTERGVAPASREGLLGLYPERA
ncbi:MAG TPA: S-methyl-5-thioribose-1-phosphate isomerase [Alphaproteobacteria bacterium]